MGEGYKMEKIHVCIKLFAPLPSRQGKTWSEYPLHMDNRVNGKNKSARENTRNLEILPKHREKTGNLVCSSCKFPDSQVKRYCDIYCKSFHFFKARISLPIQFCACNNQKPRQFSKGKFVLGRGKTRKHREFENAIRGGILKGGNLLQPSLSAWLQIKLPSMPWSVLFVQFVGAV